MYVNDNIEPKASENLININDLFKMLTVKLLFGSKVVLTLIYYPPTSSVTRNIDLNDLLAFHLDRIVQMKLPVVVAGDMNINLLNSNNYVYVNIFVISMFDLGLPRVITIPTKIKINTDNVISRFFILDQI